MTHSISTHVVVFAVFVGLTGSSLAARQAPPPASDAEELQRNTYGTQDAIIHQIPSAAFQTRLGETIDEPVRGYISAGTGQQGSFVAPLVLPNGALVSFLDLYWYDSDPGPNEVLAELRMFSGPTPPPVETLLADVRSSGSGGYGYSFKVISPPVQIDNNNRYLIYVSNAVWNGAEARAFGGVNVWYRLQMSPAPATATFGDVPKNFLYFRAIEALAASGITGGCGSGNFCPNQNVTRGEMAAFLARALGLHWPY
ncbi:MAG TPA: S-layer homology domain-containing protein [Thermoanaerobaculia bacterium]|jgi:hypothetical protein